MAEFYPRGSVYRYERNNPAHGDYLFILNLLSKAGIIRPDEIDNLAGSATKNTYFVADKDVRVSKDTRLVELPPYWNPRRWAIEVAKHNVLNNTAEGMAPFNMIFLRPNAEAVGHEFIHYLQIKKWVLGQNLFRLGNVHEIKAEAIDAITGSLCRPGIDAGKYYHTLRNVLVELKGVDSAHNYKIFPGNPISMNSMANWKQSPYDFGRFLAQYAYARAMHELPSGSEEDHVVRGIQIINRFDVRLTKKSRLEERHHDISEINHWLEHSK